MTDAGNVLDELDLGFPDRNETLLPTDRSATANPRAFDKTVRVMPKTSKELGLDARPTLHQFYPAWDVQAYIRFAQIKLHIVNSKYPEYEATGTLPQLNDGHFLVPKDDLIMHLQTYYHDLDAALTDSQRADVLAFRALVQEKLHRVLHYCRWVDPITYKEVTRPAVQSAMPFPLNRLVPKLVHMRFTASSLETFPSKEHVYLAARDAYVALNARLDASPGPFFFGPQPSSLDAFVFGHLVDALSDSQLRDVLGVHGPRLVQFATHVREAFFDSAAHAALCTQTGPNVFADLKAAFSVGFSAVPHAAYVAPYQSLSWSKREVAKADKDAKHERDGDDHDAVVSYDKSTRNVLIGGLFAIVLYGLSQLSFSIEDGDDDDDDEYYDDEE
ncbi:Aste57867_14678 [Aphanomyces stellatus]|uniref:Aste57867_14678 protein n=1 Tax=Aphanomyces stellatus TaxID=120398 RepID=A0A485L1A8_9STRA|nr:hypothetical protein As57867_014623 [Aphanomyces stellatus]VFT91496.1 Aste57867_14678 [Aphanomyces stellatus]